MAFFVQNWPRVGAIMAPIFLLFLLTEDGLPRFSIEWLFWLHLVVYMIHQVEEYLLPGHFRESLNALVTHGRRDDGPLTDFDCWVVNVVIVWGGILAGAALYPMALPAACMLGLTGVNGVVHLASGLARKRYNPGMATAIALQQPFAAYVFYRLLSESLLTNAQLLMALAAGVGVHVGIMGYLRIKQRVAG